MVMLTDSVCDKRSSRGKFVAKIKRVLDLLHFFYVQRVKGYDTPEAPSFDAETTALFEVEIKRASRYLEFGSGGSTVLAGELGIPTVSVENDRYYGQAVRRALSANANVTMLIPNLGLNGPWGTPLRPSVEKGRTYVSAPFNGSPEFPDLILVDGRYRVAAALEAARQANRGAHRAKLIFDDYVNRSHYHIVEYFLGKPETYGRSALFQIGDQAVPEAVVETMYADVR
jgi:hypothetical protein